MTTQLPGSEIAGYRIESLIGRGGMAVVYRAEDGRLGRKVALKLLTPQLADSEQFRQRFIMESRLAASLDHPNIVPIYEAGEADGQLFIAMRYVIGNDLKGLLADEGERIRACIESALNQDYANFDVIAVNDRSTDNTGAVMDELAARYPKLKVIHITTPPAPSWTGCPSSATRWAGSCSPSRRSPASTPASSPRCATSTGRSARAPRTPTSTARSPVWSR